MATCFHFERSKTRRYTGHFYKLPAKAFKSITDGPLGQYNLSGESLSKEHQYFELIDHPQYARIALFTIKGCVIPIALQLDDRSATSKLYLVCPYCQQQRQHLYTVTNTFACRQCSKLNYESQSERPMARLARRIRKLRVQMWGYDWLDVHNLMESAQWWPKPKWMRTVTFEEKRNTLEVLEQQYWSLLAEQMKITL
jgi:hypothetical protein